MVAVVPTLPFCSALLLMNIPTIHVSTRHKRNVQQTGETHEQLKITGEFCLMYVPTSDISVHFKKITVIQWDLFILWLR